MSRQEFKTKVEAGERGRVFITLPFDPTATWGKKARHYVSGTLNGVAFQGSLGVRGGVYFMPLNKEIQAEANLKPGDAVAVVMLPAAARAEALPADLAAALAKAASAKKFFEGLTAFQRNTYLKWIESAQKPETRAARIVETVSALKAGKKQH